VLLPEFRGQGAGHAFFDRREAHAKRLGFARVAFCSVVRPEGHPARPETYRPLDAFWRGRGYAPLDGVVAHFAWRDLGEAGESRKPLQFWIKDLP
jgi:GNAT superfamily N-acetyltransferase